MHQRQNAFMATIQIRNVPLTVHRTLRTRAAAAGQSLQEYLLEEITDLAQTFSLADIINDVRADVADHPEEYSDVSSASIIRQERDSH
jgi:hypothetical protein